MRSITLWAIARGRASNAASDGLTSSHQISSVTLGPIGGPIDAYSIEGDRNQWAMISKEMVGRTEN